MARLVNLASRLEDISRGIDIDDYAPYTIDYDSQEGFFLAPETCGPFVHTVLRAEILGV